MAYIDRSFYDGMSGVIIDPSEFQSMAERASDLVDAITFRAVERFGLAEGDDDYTRVKKAVAYQMEFIQRTYGSLELWAEAATEPDAGSETMGNYSHSSSASGKGRTVRKVDGLAVSPFVWPVLAPVIAMGRRI